MDEREKLILAKTNVWFFTFRVVGAIVITVASLLLWSLLSLIIDLI